MTITKLHRCPHCDRWTRVTFKRVDAAEGWISVVVFRGYHAATGHYSKPIYIEYLDWTALGVEAAA